MLVRTHMATDLPIKSYTLNHPKAYIGWAVALKKGGDRETADELCSEYVIGATDQARRGAMHMGLVESPSRGEYELTDHGADVVTETLDLFPGNNYTQVLEFFDSLRRSSKRFVEKAPKFAELAPKMMLGDDGARRLVELMQDVYAVGSHGEEVDGEGYPLETIFRDLWARDPTFAATAFIRQDDDVRKAVLGGTPDEWTNDMAMLDRDALESGTIEIEGEERPIYRDATVFQFKAIAYHMGVLTQQGREAAEIDPTDDLWGLEEGLRSGELPSIETEE